MPCHARFPCLCRRDGLANRVLVNPEIRAVQPHVRPVPASVEVRSKEI